MLHVRDPSCEARHLRVTYVPIATSESHLNRIETQVLAPMQKSLTGSDYRRGRELGPELQKAMHETYEERFVPSARVRRRLWSRH